MDEPILATGRRGYLRLHVGDKVYTLDYMPEGIDGCARAGGYYHCPEPGVSQQFQVACTCRRQFEN